MLVGPTLVGLGSVWFIRSGLEHSFIEKKVEAFLGGNVNFDLWSDFGVILYDKLTVF